MSDLAGTDDSRHLAIKVPTRTKGETKMGNRSWYETGYDGAEKEADKKAMGFPPDRLWQRPGSSKEVVFIGDDPFCIREHQWRDSQEHWHYATCISKISDSGCPACGAPGVGRADYIGHYTVVDVSGYTTRDGSENKNRLIILPAKTKVLNKFKMKKDNRGSLLGQLWSLSRADSNSPNTGDDLDHLREIKMDGLLGAVTYKGKPLKEMIERANGSGPDAVKTRKYLAHHFQIPSEGPIPMKVPQFNFPDLMAPMDYGTMKSLVADAMPFNQSKSGGGAKSSASDDVPF